MYLISYGTDTTSMVHRCESHSSFFREPYRVPWLLTYLLFYCTYNSFTLPFQGRTLNTHAAEANLHRFPLPQAPGWGAQFLPPCPLCKVDAGIFVRTFRFQTINIALDFPPLPGIETGTTAWKASALPLLYADKADVTDTTIGDMI